MLLPEEKKKSRRALAGVRNRLFRAPNCYPECQTKVNPY
jgi:hypothetical protein